MTYFVIEHLEPVVSKWMWFEYKNVSRIVGRENLIITNVKDDRERRKLSTIALLVFRESITETFLIENNDLIVLDPQALKELKPSDFSDKTVVVIGGIMGDFPPKGRTKALLCNRLPKAIKRNLGSLQFSIDGAAYIAKMISEGHELAEIPIVEGLEIEVSDKHSIILPYGYPLVNGKPLISEELLEYLKNDIDKDESEFIRLGRVKSIVEYDDE